MQSISDGALKFPLCFSHTFEKPFIVCCRVQMSEFPSCASPRSNPSKRGRSVDGTEPDGENPVHPRLEEASLNSRKEAVIAARRKAAHLRSSHSASGVDHDLPSGGSELAELLACFEEDTVFMATENAPSEQCTCTACGVGFHCSEGSLSFQLLQDVAFHCSSASHRRNLRELFPEHRAFDIANLVDDGHYAVCFVNGLATLVCLKRGGFVCAPSASDQQNLFTCPSGQNAELDTELHSMLAMQFYHPATQFCTAHSDTATLYRLIKKPGSLPNGERTVEVGEVVSTGMDPESVQDRIPVNDGDCFRLVEKP